MHSGMQIGPPVLRVRNIEKVVTFYEKGLDLQVSQEYQNDNNYNNGSLIYKIGFKNSHSDKPLFILHPDPNAKNASPRSGGLYHFAILVPDRKSLASAYISIKDFGVQYDGFADHLVSESLYLRDPENNGIEIYRDRSSREWPRDEDGHIMMDTLPLDLDSLLAEIDKEERKNVKAFPNGARIGHIHLKVTNLERSVKFYHEKLGLDITLDLKSMGAAFLSAGGYHHHIGMNTWHSLYGELHNDSDAGLESFAITISDRASFNTILHDSISEHQMTEKANKNQFVFSDPDGIPIMIKIED